MPKTETQINFKIDLNHMMNLIESQNVKVSDARHIIDRAINLMIRYDELKESRDKLQIRVQNLRKDNKELSQALKSSKKEVLKHG